MAERYPQERKYFAENASDLVDYSANPRMKRYDLSVLWPISRADLRASGVEMLSRFTSTVNGDNIDSDTPIDYVDNPQAEQGKAVFTGRWRLIKVQELKDPARPDAQGVLRHLRLYSKDSILTTDETPVIDWTLARMVDATEAVTNSQEFDSSGTSSANPAKLMVFEWDCIQPEHVADVIAEFSANFDETTEIEVDGQNYGSGYTYVFAAIKDNEEEKDGIKIVRFVVGRPEFVLKHKGALLSSKAYTGYLIWDLPQSLAQSLIDTTTATQPRGITIYPDYDKAAHTVSLRLKVRDSLVGDTTSFSGSASCMQTDTIYRYTGYTATDLQMLLSVIAASVVPGVWYDITVTEDDDDGLYDAVVVKHQAVEVVQGPLTTVITAAASGTTKKTFQTTSELALAAESGKIVRGTWTKNANCTSDLVEEKITPEDQTATSYDVSKSVDVTAVIHTENPDPLVKPTATKGTIVRQTAQPTEVGKQRTSEETIIPTDQIAVSVDNAPSFANTKTIHTENDTDLTTPTVVAGQINRQEATPTDAGNQRTLEETLIPTNQTETGESHSAAADATEQVDTEMAKTNYDAMSKVAAAGTIRDIDAVPTEAGNVRVRDRVVTPVDQTSNSGEKSAARTVTVEEHTQKSSEPTVPAHVAGHIYQVDSRPTEAGKFNTRETDIEVIDQTATGGEDSLSRSVSQESHTENTSVPAVTAAAGTIKRVEAANTDAGRYRTVETTIAPKSRTVTEGAADAFETSLNTLKTQETTAESVPSAVAGKVIAVRNQPTDTGFQTEKTEVSAVAKTVSFTSVVADKFTQETEKYRNADAIPNASGVANALVQVDGAMNRFEKYDYEKTTRTAKVPDSCATPVSWWEYSKWLWETVSTFDQTKVYEQNWVSSARAYRWCYYHTLSYHLTAAAAAAAVTGGDEGSGLSSAGDNLWQAHKVVISVAYGTTYSFQEPEFKENEGISIPPIKTP